MSDLVIMFACVNRIQVTAVPPAAAGTDRLARDFVKVSRSQHPTGGLIGGFASHMVKREIAGSSCERDVSRMAIATDVWAPVRG